MLPIRPSRSTRLGLLLSALVLTGCGQRTPTVSVWISGPRPACPTASPCDVFAGDSVPGVVARILATPNAGQKELAAGTGLTWTRRDVPAEPLYVDLDSVLAGKPTDAAAWVVETVKVAAPEVRLISVGSAGGMALWVNGRRVVRSRYPHVGAMRHSEVARVQLNAGTNVLAYRVIENPDFWKLYREWWPTDRTLALLGRTIDANSFSDVLARFVPEHARFVHFKPATVNLGDTPQVRLRWTDLLGGHPTEWNVFPGSYPDSLALPAGFDGSALLELEVRDPRSGARLYYEATPIFTEARASSMAKQLLGLPGGPDPVLTARRDLVRRAFEGDSTTDSFPGWIRAQALTDLVRIVRDPQGYPRYPGPQVWAYRPGRDGPAIPYWLFVPPDVQKATGDKRPLVFSVNHLTNADFWHGRGGQPGFLIGETTLAGSHGTFGVIPHLGGLTDITAVGAVELPAILSQLEAVLPVDTTRVGLMVWSSHAGNALRLAVDPHVTVSDIGMAVPDVSPSDRAIALPVLSQRRPGLRIQVWGAADDDLMTPARVGELAMALQNAGAKATYVSVPHSTHLSGMLYNVEADLRTAMGAPSAAESDTTSSSPPPAPGR